MLTILTGLLPVLRSCGARFVGTWWWTGNTQRPLMSKRNSSGGCAFGSWLERMFMKRNSTETNQTSGPQKARNVGSEYLASSGNYLNRNQRRQSLISTFSVANLTKLCYPWTTSRALTGSRALTVDGLPGSKITTAAIDSISRTATEDTA